MPVSVDYDGASRIAVITVAGEASTELFRQAMVALTSSPSFPPDVDALWDLRALDMSRTDGRFTAALVDVRAEFPARGSARVALVVDSDLGFGTGRQFELRAGSASPAMALFRTVEEARAWLQSGGAEPAPTGAR